MIPFLPSLARGGAASDILHQPAVQFRPTVAEEAEGGAVALDPVEVERRDDHALFLAVQLGQMSPRSSQMKLVP